MITSDQKKSLETALGRWEKVLSCDSNHELALYYSASNHIALGRPDSGQAYIDALVNRQELEKQSRPAELKALKAAHLMEHAEAIEYWQEAIKVGYEPSSGYHRIAREYLLVAQECIARGEFELARQNADLAAQGSQSKLNRPMLERISLLKARTFVREENWLDAIRSIGDISEYTVQRKSAAMLLIKCYLELSELSKAEDLIATTSGCDLSDEYLSIAKHQLKAGNAENARRYIEQASAHGRTIQNKEILERVSVLEARCLVKEQRWADAIACLEGAECYQTLREAALKILFKCYLHESRLEQADELCQLFDDEKIDNRFNLRGQLLFRKLNYLDAKQAFTKSKEIEGRAVSVVWLIKTLMTLNERETARQEAKGVETTLPKELVLQGRCWEAAGELGMAEERFRSAVKQDGVAKSYESLINFLYTQRSWGKAHQVITTARKAGISSNETNQIADQIERAYIAVSGENVEGGSPDIPLDFLSTESMVSAIVARVLKKADRPAKRVSPRSSARTAIVISSLGPGGAERQAVNLANGLHAGSPEGDVVMLCTHLSRRVQDLFYAPLLSPGIEKVEYFKRHEIVDKETVPELADYWDLIEHIQPTTRQTTIVHMARALVKYKPDVVHAWLDETFINASLVCGMLGIQNIVGRWGSMPAGVNRTVTERSLHNIRYLEHAYGEIKALPELKYTSNSRLTGDAYADMMSMEREAVDIVYNGVDSNNLDVSAAEVNTLRTSLNVPKSALVIGTVIRLSEEKRPELWLDVASEVSKLYPDVHFIVVGGGPMEAIIAEKAFSMGVNIHLVGKQDNVGVWYRLFDILLLTSRVEGVSNVVVEAQWCGVPVVVPNVGGLSEAVLDGKTGFLLDDHSLFSFTRELIKLLDDKALRKSMGADARIYASNKFSSDQMVGRYLDIYNK